MRRVQPVAVNDNGNNHTHFIFHLPALMYVCMYHCVTGLPVFPIRIGGLQVHSLGKVRANCYNCTYLSQLNSYRQVDN